MQLLGSHLCWIETFWWCCCFGGGHPCSLSKLIKSLVYKVGLLLVSCLGLGAHLSLLRKSSPNRVFCLVWGLHSSLLLFLWDSEEDRRKCWPYRVMESPGVRVEMSSSFSSQCLVFWLSLPGALIFLQSVKTPEGAKQDEKAFCRNRPHRVLFAFQMSFSLNSKSLSFYFRVWLSFEVLCLWSVLLWLPQHSQSPLIMWDVLILVAGFSFFFPPSSKLWLHDIWQSLFFFQKPKLEVSVNCWQSCCFCSSCIVCVEFL